MLGQLAFLRTSMHWILLGDVLFAVTLESIAVYLAYHAHVALISNDSALRLRMASYGCGLLIGLMNYSHYSDHWVPTFKAIALGLLSASSPWLWGIHSRRESRDALMKAGLIEAHAVRLGANRWAWHPLRSIRVMYAATWTGEANVMRAIALVPELALAPDENMCADGTPHEPYNAKPGSRYTRCRKCRASLKVEPVLHAVEQVSNA